MSSRHKHFIKTCGRTLDGLEDGLDGRDLLALQIGLLLGVDDLAVVDDDGVAGGALAVVPADGGGELGVVVGAEDLWEAGVSLHCF